MSRLVKIFAGLYQFDQKDFNESCFVIGVDKGALELLKNNIEVDLAVGDFDSVTEEELEIIKSNVKEIKLLNKEKDDTDLEHVFSHYINKEDRVICYGVLGNRIDHTYTNLLLLAKYKDYNIVLLDENNKIYLLKKGEYKILKDGYKYFSLYAAEDSLISLKECKYPLNEYKFTFLETLVTSNEIIGVFSKVFVHEGSVFVIQSNG